MNKINIISILFTLYFIFKASARIKKKQNKIFILIILFIFMYFHFQSFRQKK